MKTVPIEQLSGVGPVLGARFREHLRFRRARRASDETYVERNRMLWGYRNEATKDMKQFSDCFLFFGADHQREERFLSRFVLIRTQLPPPTVSAGSGKKPAK